MSQLSPDTVRRLRAIPLIIRHGFIAIAMEDAGNVKIIEELNFLSAHRVVPIVATAHVIREGIAHYYDRIQDAAIVRELRLDPAAQGSETPEREADRLAREKSVVRLVNDLIATVVQRRASDIHLRPGEQGAEILYRIDGEMVPVRHLMHALQPAVVSRIKVIADMNLAEHRRPLDGRTTFMLDDGCKVDLRVSVLPAVHSESVVVRLLDTNQSHWSVDQLGLAPADRVRFDDVMGRSFGMFLATGPTGCGKSTTLYAMLLELRKRRINILTIEDPVELYIGVALAPVLWIMDRWSAWCAGLHDWTRWPALGTGFGIAFFIAGFTLLAVVPVYNFLLPTRVKPFKGGYFSIASIPWFLHNGLFYLVRYTVLPFFTLTPFDLLFLKAMGMKLGKRAFVNTEFISDPRLITLGDDAVIGGCVHLFAHYGGGGHLTVAPVVIGDRVTIGQKATVMGDVEIGADAMILPHSVLLPGSRICAGETWGGVPARRISREEMEHFKQGIHGVAGSALGHPEA